MNECEAEGNCGRAWSSRDYWIAGSSIAAGAALGLGIMYLFDPERGKRRRHLIRDQAQRKLRYAQREFVGRAEDVVNRATGAIRNAASSLGCHEEVSDDVLRDRVRSRLGHLVEHADHVETEIRDGIVNLRGTAPSVDRNSLLKALRRVPGVRGVEDLLTSSPV